MAEAYYAERLDLYWYYYQRFYLIAHKSKAHSRFCEIVYGRDLCQEGQIDMPCFEGILYRLNLGPDDHLLDLGCGAGGLSQYVSDITGARVRGVDYSASAIETASARTESKRDRISFIEANLNALKLPKKLFDAAISIDSIYWVADMASTVSAIAKTVKSGGDPLYLDRAQD